MTDTNTHAARTTAAIALLATTFCATCTSPREREDASKRAVEAPADASHADVQPVAAGPARVEPSVAPEPEPAGAEPVAPFELAVPGCTAKLTFVPVRVGARGAPAWISTTEVTWDMYDAFVFAMDRAETEKDPPDAFARPSKPYILMDRGFGHAGYPVISVSFRGAREFCRWLSSRTGRTIRLPTESEWELAAHDDGAPPLDAQAWYQANSKTRGRATTKPVGRKPANAHGLHDLYGNAAEWTVAADGTGVLRGGSFKDPAEKVGPGARVPDDPSFNATDPQIPKSVWWLADGPFAGFRVLAEP